MDRIYNIFGDRIINQKAQPNFSSPFIILDTLHISKPQKERKIIVVGSKSNIKGIMKRSGLSIFLVGRLRHQKYYIYPSNVSLKGDYKKVKSVPSIHKLIIDTANCKFKITGPRAENIWKDGKVVIKQGPKLPPEFTTPGRRKHKNVH